MPALLFLACFIVAPAVLAGVLVLVCLPVGLAMARKGEQPRSVSQVHPGSDLRKRLGALPTGHDHLSALPCLQSGLPSRSSSSIR